MSICSFSFKIYHIPTKTWYKDLGIVSFTPYVVRVAYDKVLDLKDCEISIEQCLSSIHK